MQRPKKEIIFKKKKEKKSSLYTTLSILKAYRFHKTYLNHFKINIQIPSWVI